MTPHESRAPRLYVPEPLSTGVEIALERAQSHYLATVMRLNAGDPVRIFNERDGEWLAHLASARKGVAVRAERRVADVQPPPDIDLVFAPLKQLRLDYAVQKATELGVRRLRPVITERTMVRRVNADRLRANAIEAAEQCNLVFLPEIAEPQSLEAMLGEWDPGRRAVYCDETAPVSDPVAALGKLRLPVAVLIGPEGGFTSGEQAMLRSLPFVTPISLGPRIIRADTAAVAALALIQAVAGDWHS
jgi:16S rRNA (uracil1498-N3)-methyltransferase